MDNPDFEVELDSLGLFFMHLIDDDICQDDAEASHADATEVIILSSDSETLPSQKICDQTGKLNFLILLLIWILNFLWRLNNTKLAAPPGTAAR